MQRHDYQNIIEKEYERRSKINPSYSLRSFASGLAISSSALSEIISGKRKISLKKAENLLPVLKLSMQEQDRFINSVKSIKARYKKKKQFKDIDLEYMQLKEDTFEVISDWYYYAILNLSKVTRLELKDGQIAKRLGITKTKANIAIDRLLRLNLLRIEDGILKRTTEKLKFTEDIPSLSLQNYHRGVLEKAIESLELDPVTERDITSIAMAIDSSKLEKAKEKIKRFRREMSDYLEAGQSDRVYNLNIQLIPMDKKGN